MKSLKLSESEIVLSVVPKNEYSQDLVRLIKIIAKQNNSVCYVSANKPMRAILKLFDKTGVDPKKFLIIDCITTGPLTEKRAGSTIFMRSPKNLTGLAITVGEAVDQGVENIFVDALSTFIIYTESPAVVRFAHSLITRLRVADKKGVFIIVKGDIGKGLLDDLSMFVDNVIELT